MKSIIDRAGLPGLIVAVFLLTALVLRGMPVAAQEGLALPAPAVDLPASQAPSQVMVVAGGCFWGVQGVFQHVKGVSNAVSGYAGGAKSTAIYERTNDGTTGHAESVQVTFDPRQVSYGQLLQVFFSVAHDPTQLNRQGPDTGTQYRSTIFAANAEQAEVAKAYIAPHQGWSREHDSYPARTRIPPGSARRNCRLTDVMSHRAGLFPPQILACHAIDYFSRGLCN